MAAAHASTNEPIHHANNQSHLCLLGSRQDVLYAGGAPGEEEAAKPGGGGEVCTPQWEGAAVPADAADTDWPRCTEGCNKAEGELIHSTWGTLLSWLFLVDLEHFPC